MADPPARSRYTLPERLDSALVIDQIPDPGPATGAKPPIPRTSSRIALDACSDASTAAQVVSRVLVIGASGQVGEHLANALRARRADVVGTRFSQDLAGMPQLDARDPAAVEALLDEVEPDAIVVPAAQPNVDLCEREPEVTYDVNVRGTAVLGAAAARRGLRMVWLSTDYLFDGTSGPYPENTPARPIQEYGRQKLAGEHFLLAAVPDVLIVRTNVVYGWERQGKNFVQRLVKVLSTGEPMRAPVDQFSTPTYAPNLAAIVAELLERGVTGVVNVSGPDWTDRHTFASEAARAFGLDPEAIARVSTPELNQHAARPLKAGLTGDRVRALVQTEPLSYRDGLAAMAAARPASVASA